MLFFKKKTKQLTTIDTARLKEKKLYQKLNNKCTNIKQVSKCFEKNLKVKYVLCTKAYVNHDFVS